MKLNAFKRDGANKSFKDDFCPCLDIIILDVFTFKILNLFCTSKIMLDRKTDNPVKYL